MTDGNMAIHVSPADDLEPEMKMVWSLFNRASNAIVNASELAKKVAAQEADTSHLREALSAIEEVKRSLEERLAQTTGNLHTLTENWRERGQTINEHEATIHQLQAERDSLTHRLDAATSDRDGWQSKAQDWEKSYWKTAEELDTAEAKLATMRATMQTVFGDGASQGGKITEQPKAPEPQPILNPPQEWAKPLPPSEDQSQTRETRFAMEDDKPIAEDRESSTEARGFAGEYNPHF